MAQVFSFSQTLFASIRKDFFWGGAKRKLLVNYIVQYQIKVYNAILVENINLEGENKFDEVLSIS
nr:hypothetical protein [uncultured Blautia sp.]